MSISHYIKEIGRGKQGARDLDRAQAADLMGQLLQGSVSDLEVGAFCLAMRIKGETAQEMAGFLDAIRTHSLGLVNQGCPTVVLPCYNGARKLPALTALLALLLARQGLGVVLHGHGTEERRVSTSQVLAALGVPAQTTQTTLMPVQAGHVQWWPTELLCPGLARLLEVRRVVGLRNSAHSLVKLMNPCQARAVVVGSYTHPEYAHSMTQTHLLMGSTALLLRGTEGEPVADPRRTPAMDAIDQGVCSRVQEAQGGSLAQLPDLPDMDAASTAGWITAVLEGQFSVPAPIACQVAQIEKLARAQG